MNSDLPPNGKLVKLARMDEESTAYARHILRAVGGDGLKTIVHKGRPCTTPGLLATVFSLDRKWVSSYQTFLRDYFEKLGVELITDKDHLKRISEHLEVQRTSVVALWPPQAIVFLLLGSKDIAGDLIMRSESRRHITRLFLRWLE
jgi:hypothetical protein